MKSHIRSLAIRIVCIVLIFTAAIVGLLFISDVLLKPILLEISLDSTKRNWCGVFSRCASGTQQSFFDYLRSGAPWRRLDIEALENRARLAAIFGVFMGAGFVGFSFFASRRGA